MPYGRGLEGAQAARRERVTGRQRPRQGVRSPPSPRRSGEHIDQPRACPKELARQKPSDALPTARVFATIPTNATRQKDYRRAGIPLVDESGRYADLHSLRVCLGTRLARAGTAPQVARQIMRHSRYETTLALYTALGISDASAAMNELPSPPVTPATLPHQIPHQSAHETVRSDAS